MSKAAKQSIFILIFLIIGVLAFAGYTLVEKQKVEDSKILVEQELEDSEMRTHVKIQEIKKLNDDIQVLEKEKNNLEKTLATTRNNADKLKIKIAELTKDRDTWKGRIEVITRERDALTKKISDLNQNISSTRQQLNKQLEIMKSIRNQDMAGQPQPSGSAESAVEVTEIAGASNRIINVAQKNTGKPNIPPASDEGYWATLLAEKAALEVHIEEMEQKLAQSSIEIVELKQQNEAMKLELDSLRTQSDDLAQEIKYKGNMINNLSLELARTKNDKKYVADRLAKIQDENRQLRGDMKKLVTAKSSLQKSIVRLTQDKNKVEKELGSAESLIQSKIDEIWEIKDSLDRSFKQSAQNMPKSSNPVQLPPIMVHANQASARTFNVGATEPGYNGRVVSINEENNFVIIDIGEASGIQLGDDVSVYRDSKYIARLEIIQVRKDISAADIKDQWSKLKVGDIIR